METPRKPRPRVRILIGAATALGLEVIERYRKMEAKTARSVDRDMASFAKLLTKRARKGRSAIAAPSKGDDAAGT